jgi:tripartite-type tricarboxylate transporter receptor subunit TctC
MEKFVKLTGSDLVRVPFRGGNETVTGVISGAIPVSFSGLSNWASYLQAGKVVGLATDSPLRLPVISDVPTLGELGHKIDLTRVYFGIVAPAGTPKPILERLRNDMAAVINDPDFREKHLTSRGHEAVANTPDEFAKFLAVDRLVSRRIVNDVGLQPQ